MSARLQPFGPGLWLADGAQVQVIGFAYPTRMAVIRLADGGLLIWSPVALTEPLKGEVEALGPVTRLVAPNSLHDRYLAEWRQAFPDAQVHVAPGFAATPGAITLSEAPPADWAEDLDQVVVRGNRITTEVVFFHRPSRTVIFTDLLQQFPPGWFKGWRAIVARLDLMTASEPAVPRKFRVAFNDRASARAAIRRILAWPAEAVLMAHGRPVERDGQAFLARAFAWLKP